MRIWNDPLVLGAGLRRLGDTDRGQRHIQVRNDRLGVMEQQEIQNSSRRRMKRERKTCIHRQMIFNVLQFFPPTFGAANSSHKTPPIARQGVFLKSSVMANLSLNLLKQKTRTALQRFG
jgi:hypothetical protein